MGAMPVLTRGNVGHVIGRRPGSRSDELDGWEVAAVAGRAASQEAIAGHSGMSANVESQEAGTVGSRLACDRPGMPSSHKGSLVRQVLAFEVSCLDRVIERQWRALPMRASPGGPCRQPGGDSPDDARSRLTAALIRARWVYACGKLPSASPAGPICSANSPTWLA
jgi:hypothetical protein